MPNVVKKKLIFVAVFTNVFQHVNVQIAMPMYMPAAVPQPVFAMPPPIAVAIQLPEPVTKTSTTTTTTTQAPNIAIAVQVPVPVPMAVQYAVPAPPPPIFCQGQPRPKGCPPCPPCVCMPSCTPAFFSYCSPCHLKCRCRNPNEAPVPMPPVPPVPVPGPAYPVPIPVAPAPIVGPPPVVVLPLPPAKPLLPRRPRKRCWSQLSSSSLSSDDTSFDSSSECYKKRRGRKFKRRRTKILYRRNARISSESSDSNIVRPIISYVSENGDVKFETKISSKEAKDFLKGKTSSSDEKQTVHVLAKQDGIVVSNGPNSAKKSGRKYDKILLRDSPKIGVLKEGKSRIIFKPPPHKRINNVAMSFQIS